MRRDDDLGPDEPERAAVGGSPPSDDHTPASAGIRPRHVLIGVFGLLLLAFAVANFTSVRVNFLVFQTRARVITVILVAGALGFLIGYLVGRPGRAERRYLRERDRDRERDR
jgi:uncharacterized integral membrane protein